MNLHRLPQPLERATQTFSGRTVEVLRDMIVAGQLRAGERLNEVELASALGISRGPLREAIQRLRSEGLLVTVANRGAYVRTFTAQQLRELYEVRIALETHAVRLAASNADAAAMNGLHQMLEETERALVVGSAYPRDLDFHQSLIALANNQALLDAATEVHRQVEMARSRSGHEPARALTALTEHKIIVDHLTARRGEGAAKALAKHLRSALENALAILDHDADAAANPDRRQ